MNKLDIENIFLDLDGTALKSDKTISKKTLSIIKDLKKKNINVFVATGRPSYMISQEINELNVNPNVICANGGTIFNFEHNKFLEIKKIDLIFVNKIEMYLSSIKIPYLIYTDKKMFYNCSKNNKWVDYLTTRIKNLTTEHQWGLNKIDSSFKSQEHIVLKFLIPTFHVEKKLLDKLSLWLMKEMPLFTFVESQANILDIIPLNSSKGEGIKFIANLFSLNLNKSIAFGDAENDMSMFNVVRYSVAMNNAVDKLKKIATFITDSNDEEGIYHFIKNNIL